MDAELDIPHSVLIEGQRIAFSQTGKGCRVALLHGIPTSRLLWRHVVPLLAERGCEVTAIGLLGLAIRWDCHRQATAASTASA